MQSTMDIATIERCFGCAESIELAFVGCSPAGTHARPESAVARDGALGRVLVALQVPLPALLAQDGAARLGDRAARPHPSKSPGADARYMCKRLAFIRVLTLTIL